MRVLTLTQPWATLIAVGAKRIETRGWRSPFVGDIAIHAAAGLGPVGGVTGLLELCATFPFSTALAGHGLSAGDLPRGAVVCVARVERYERMTPRSIAELGPVERVFGHYAPGRWAWHLADVRPLARPLPMRGSLGLTHVADHQSRQIARLVAEHHAQEATR